MHHSGKGCLFPVPLRCLLPVSRPRARRASSLPRPGTVRQARKRLAGRGPSSVADFLDHAPEGCGVEVVLVALAKSPARNSLAMLGEPLLHLGDRPLPFKRMGVA